MGEWKECKLGNVCVQVLTGGTPLTKKTEYHLNGKIPWLKTKEVNFCRINNTENYISELGLANSAAKLIPANSVIVAMYGQGDTAGRVAINKIPLATNQACCNLVIDDGSADYQFIYYLLKNSYFELVQRKTGSAQPNLNTKLIKDLDILLPPLPEQRTIASVLSSLDDKIYLLHRQNKTLEAMAETLFRQWFVEEANEGWEERPLSSVADFLNGLAYQKYPPQNEVDKLPVLKIKELRNGFSKDSGYATTEVKPEYLVENGDVIFSWSASLMVKMWDGEKCILNQHLFKVTSEDYPKWFYYQWCKYHLEEFVSISASHATTMGHIKRGDLDVAMVLVPSSEELKEMTKSMKPFVDKLIENNKQIRTLENLRDALLPKLMSGEVKVQFGQEAIL